MNRVLALVEGQTERTFVRDVLTPGLASAGVFVSARLIGKPGHKGGVRAWSAARRELLTLLKQDPNAYVTTMFDYYGLPRDWPGAGRANRRHANSVADGIERAIHADIRTAMGNSFNPVRFIPYLFADARIRGAALQ